MPWNESTKMDEKLKFTWWHYKTKSIKQDNPFAFLGTAMAVAIINPLIDTFVTPSSLSMMMKGEKPSLEGKEARNSKSQSDTDVSMSYDGMNRFIVTVKKKMKMENHFNLFITVKDFFHGDLLPLTFLFNCRL